MDDVLQLIKSTYEKNKYGVNVAVEEKREIFCKCDSINRSEFFEAGRNGLNPSYRFTVAAVDYDDEILIEYNSKRYAVYRTYNIPGTDYMELYVERQGGANGKKGND